MRPAVIVSWNCHLKTDALQGDTHSRKVCQTAPPQAGRVEAATPLSVHPASPSNPRGPRPTRFSRTVRRNVQLRDLANRCQRGASLNGSRRARSRFMRTTAVFILLACSRAMAQENPTTALKSPAAQRRIDSLHELSSSLEALSHRVSKSVVQIFASGYRLSGDP